MGINHPPLQGLSLLNTRPSNQGELLNYEIKQLGGNVITLPLLSIRKKNDWLNQLSSVAAYRKLLFTSQNAARIFMQSIEKKQIQLAPDACLIAIGEATAKELQQYSSSPVITPSSPDSEHVLRLSQLNQIKQENILLVKGEGGRGLLEKELNCRGCKLTIFDVYKRCPSKISEEKINSLWRNNQVNIILFTSGEAIQHLVKVISTQGLVWLYQIPCIVISKRLADISDELGIKNTFIVKYENIVEFVLNYSRKGLLHGRRTT
jgi:uroporphyrinogen-III synthase